MRFAPLFVFVTVFLFSFTSAQSQDGTIRVEVYDAEAGEPLIGATVLILGTTNGNITDLDGKASITDLEYGTYNIQVSYISYQTQVFENVSVVDKSPVLIAAGLQQETVGLDEVVVQAEIIKSGENALLTVQRKSVILLDAISSEQFSRNGDSDAASAIKRVTGVTVEGGKYIFVRGLGDRYSKTNLNGSTIPGLDPNKNAVQLDIFPSSLIDNIIVYKTFSPELAGDFTGGLVDITTKDFPDKFTFQISASTGFNSQATFNENYLTSTKGGLDFMGVDNGFRALPDELEGLNAQNFPQPYIDNERLDLVTKSFDDVGLDNVQGAAPLNHSLNVSVGNQHKLFSKSSFGYVAAVSHMRDFEFYDQGKTGRYSAGAGATELIPEAVLNDSRGTESVLLSGLLNTSFKLDNNNKFRLNMLYNESGVNVSRYQEGLRARPDINPDRMFQSRSIAYLDRSMANVQLRGQHNIPSLNNLSIEWQGSYTDSNQEEPDIKFFANNKNIQSDGSIRYGFDAATSRRPSRYYRNLTETNLDNKVDFNWPIKIGEGKTAKIKFGGAYTEKSREFREDRYEYFLSNSIQFEGDVKSFLADENLGIREDGSLGHFLSNVTERRNNFDASQKVSAGYLAMEYPLTQRVKLNGGVRIETTNINLESFDGTTGEIDEVDLLPAINVTYGSTEKVNFRGSYTRTLARPTFREIAPLATFDFVGDFFQLGNPELERTLIDNFDLRWEYYPSPSEYISVSGFFKSFDNPIENTIVPQSGTTDGEYKFNNVDAAELYGLEFEVRKSLEFISPRLADFKIGTNVTIVRSFVDINDAEYASLINFNPEASRRRDMYNQSPYVVNANLIYNKESSGWSGNATFNVFGARLSYVATAIPYIYEQPRPELNLAIGKTINRKISLRARANNLLNPDFMQSMDYRGNEFVFQSYNYGRTYSLSISYIVE